MTDYKTWNPNDSLFGLVKINGDTRFIPITNKVSWDRFFLRTPPMIFSRGVDQVQRHVRCLDFDLTHPGGRFFYQQMIQFDQWILRQCTKPCNQINWFNTVVAPDVLKAHYHPIIKSGNMMEVRRQDHIVTHTDIHRSDLKRVRLDHFDSGTWCRMLLGCYLWWNQVGWGVGWCPVKIKTYLLAEKLQRLQHMTLPSDIIGRKDSVSEAPVPHVINYIDESLKEDVLYGDPFRYVISTFLSPRELYRLRSVNRMYRHLITDNLIYETTILEINRRLSQILGDHLENFYQVLQQVDGGISGSLILQCLLGESWEGSDIDIYLPHRHDWNQETLVDGFLRQVLGTQPEMVNSYLFNMKCENRIREHTIQETRFQVIVIQTPYDDLEQFICADYDMDVCMNLYDGQRFFCHSLSAVMNKRITCQFKPGDKRKLKYQRREFAFNPIPDSLPSNPVGLWVVSESKTHRPPTTCDHIC